MNKRLRTILWTGMICLTVSCSGERIGNAQCDIRVAKDCTVTFRSEGVQSQYTPVFTVIRSVTDPAPEMRPAGIPGVLYNAVTWKSDTTDVQAVKRTDDQTGDGFDSSILEGKTASRTFGLFNVGERVEMRPSSAVRDGDRIRFTYPSNKHFTLEATLTADSLTGYPALRYTLRPKSEGWYSVGYTGFAPVDTSRVEELWQPMIWQERRFPDRSYATLAFRCPVPATFVTTDGISRGVVAPSSEFPFDPLPTATNSRFCVALRTPSGELSPMLFAPVPGGAESKMSPGKAYNFTALLFACKGNTTDAVQKTAEKIYAFRDLRHNDISTLNHTIEHIIDYTMSKYSWFIDQQKGCAYSTDVPGAIKNVSALNPLEIALLNDDTEMFTRRAYPILEYLLSREKFLFSADSTQRIQYPSRRLDGPCAPISELTTLNNVLQQRNPFLLRLAKQEYGKTRVRNLDVTEKGQTWKNALHLYKATGDTTYLSQAIQGADAYIAARMDRPATDFSDPEAGGFFFWTGFAPKWIDLLELYEITHAPRHLEAAHRGARLYTQYIWYCPEVPSGMIEVNPEGKAPHYAYLAQKGHLQMDAPTEQVEAWRLSEIGLTPESSGTCTGHRAIFMANYAAWFMRMAHYTGDDFLALIAKNAIVGRYRNFPGYHINTARTTIYEKADYPLRGHKELGVNSFHYNHIMPHVTLLYDYLISEVLYRSQGSIRFPDEFIEAYAYLQSKFYGHKAGEFYGEQAWLWMPDGLAESSNGELNYLAARSDGALYLAFSNQTGEEVTSDIRLDVARLGMESGGAYSVRLMSPQGSCGELREGVFRVTVPGNGLTAVKIQGVHPQVGIQRQLLDIPKAWTKDYDASADNRVRCMLLNTGVAGQKAYIYFNIDDVTHRSATVIVNGVSRTSTTYPYEFTFEASAEEVVIEASATDRKGGTTKWEVLTLKK